MGQLLRRPDGRGEELLLPEIVDVLRHAHSGSQFPVTVFFQFRDNPRCMSLAI